MNNRTNTISSNRNGFSTVNYNITKTLDYSSQLSPSENQIRT